jgi:hypothetical protein
LTQDGAQVLLPDSPRPDLASIVPDQHVRVTTQKRPAADSQEVQSVVPGIVFELPFGNLECRGGSDWVARVGSDTSRDPPKVCKRRGQSTKDERHERLGSTRCRGEDEADNVERDFERGGIAEQGRDGDCREKFCFILLLLGLDGLLVALLEGIT